MSIEQHINSWIDGKEKAGILDDPVDFVTAAVLLRPADTSKGHSMTDDRKPGCLTDNDIAAYIEQKKKHPEYARFVRHMAGCETCRRNALEAEALLSIDTAGVPADIVEKAFSGARTGAARRHDTSFLRRYRVPLAAAASLVIAAAAVLYLLVLRPAGGPAQVTFFMGNISITRGGRQVQPAIKLQVRDGDVVRTGPSSFMLVQSDESAVIRIAENSEVTMKSIINTRDRVLSANGARVLSRVKKLAKSASYRIETSTVVVAVRGTEFSVNDRAGTSTVAVRSGSVEITRRKGPEKDIVPQGRALGISDKKEERPITAAENLELENLSKIPIIDAIEKKTGAEIEKIIRSRLGAEGMPQGTLTEMKAKYGHIDTITLYNNRVITGVITSRGANYTIVTPGGIILVPDRQIRTIKVQ